MEYYYFSSRVNDGSCLSNMQCVLTPETEGYDQIDSINTGASVLVDGVVASSQGGKQKVELKVSKIIVCMPPKFWPKFCISA
ncbi:Asparaginyl-tRNA synthetase, chloroplastic/mitochondrial [Triticum urartu]|uniref:Asparaginyl-tRNA synthetase, chloroplastic/mitochondrial n=1 Tax=Triticum urartu TaxID=4572 RepID=M7ZRU6_TRIUA|nr:Asparaginyl-tRNA synthetase, chloroplastic/mitochondrial [Triticum urartu]